MKGVVLLTMARSRSSMTAEVFRRHGVFFGKTRPRNTDKYVGYNENIALSRIARVARPDSYSLIIRDKDPTLRVDDFADVWSGILTVDGFGTMPHAARSGLWGAKVDVFCHATFAGLDHVKIGIWRNVEDIVASCRRAIVRKDGFDWRKVVLAHHDELRDLEIPTINTDEVVAGEHNSLALAFEACGLTYDQTIGEAVIEI